MDLRTRVVAAVEGGLSCNEAARRFNLAISTAINWMRRKRDTGSVAPGQMGGHKPRLIRGEHEAWLLERIQRADYTLRGLVAELAERGLKVDYRSGVDFVHEQDQSFKKNRAGQRAGSSRRRAKARAVA
jgi:putative transposase